MKTTEQERARLWRLAGGAVDRLWKYLDKHKWGRSKDERLMVDARSMQQIVSDALAEAVVGAEPDEAEKARPRRWAVAALRKSKWLVLPGRYETESGARLTMEFASLGGNCLVVEVVAGPVEQPENEAVRSSDWLGEAEAALVLAEKAVNNAGLEGEWDSLPKLERGVRGLREGIEARRRPSPSEAGSATAGAEGPRSSSAAAGSLAAGATQERPTND